MRARAMYLVAAVGVRCGVAHAPGTGRRRHGASSGRVPNEPRRLLAPGAQRTVAVPAAGRVDVRVDRRDRRRDLGLALHRRRRREAGRLRHRPVHRPGDLGEQHDAEHAGRQRDPRGRRQGDLLRRRRHLENWRVDANQFPASVQGSKNGWPGEKWLDIRQTRSCCRSCRLACRNVEQAGFDGVEWDNVYGYSNKTGFPLTANDQLVYDASLANLAHQYGLTVAMKNDVEQVPNLASYFDYAINEQCQQYNECGNYTTSFVNAGKTCSRWSTSCSSRSSARRPTPRTETRSRRPSICSTRRGRRARARALSGRSGRTGTRRAGRTGARPGPAGPGWRRSRPLTPGARDRCNST